MDVIFSCDSFVSLSWSTILAFFRCLTSFLFLTSGRVAAAASLLASTSALHCSVDRCDSVIEVLSTLQFVYTQSEKYWYVHQSYCWKSETETHSELGRHVTSLVDHTTSVALNVDCFS